MPDSHYEVTENRIVKLIRAALATSFAVAETLFRSRARHEGDAAHAPGARDHRPPHSPEQGLRHCKRRVGVGTNQPYDSVFCNIIM